jgi:hypothetical protein
MAASPILESKSSGDFPVKESVSVCPVEPAGGSAEIPAISGGSVVPSNLEAKPAAAPEADAAIPIAATERSVPLVEASGGLKSDGDNPFSQVVSEPVTAPSSGLEVVPAETVGPTPQAAPVESVTPVAPVAVTGDAGVQISPKTEPAVQAEKLDVAPTIAVPQPRPSSVESPGGLKPGGGNPFSQGPSEPVSEPVPAQPESPGDSESLPASGAAVVEESAFTRECHRQFAWQPFTFGGVAAFGRSTMTHLFIIQLMMACLAGVAVLLFVHRNFSPVIQESVRKMPEAAMIRQGRLEGATSGGLAENKFLTIIVDLDGNGQLGQSADLQLELRRDSMVLCPMFRAMAGVMVIQYPYGHTIILDRSVADPWWGAWRPILYTGVFVGTVVLLMIVWTILATIYAFVVRLIAYYADRSITLGGSWKLAYAALMPGAAVMVAGIVLYGWQWMDLLGLLIFAVGHVPVGWIYLLVSPLRLPRVDEVTVTAPNPFDRA